MYYSTLKDSESGMHIFKEFDHEGSGSNQSNCVNLVPSLRSDQPDRLASSLVNKKLSSTRLLR